MDTDRIPENVDHAEPWTRKGDVLYDAVNHSLTVDLTAGQTARYAADSERAAVRGEVLDTVREVAEAREWGGRDRVMLEVRDSEGCVLYAVDVHPDGTPYQE